MIKQKRSKPTAYGKKRVNVFKLEKRVQELERKLELQMRINQKHINLNRLLSNDVENIQHQLKAFSSDDDKGVVGNALNRFWAWLGR